MHGHEFYALQICYNRQGRRKKALRCRAPGTIPARLHVPSAGMFAMPKRKFMRQLRIHSTPVHLNIYTVDHRCEDNRVPANERSAAVSLQHNCLFVTYICPQERQRVSQALVSARTRPDTINFCCIGRPCAVGSAPSGSAPGSAQYPSAGAAISPEGIPGPTTGGSGTFSRFCGRTGATYRPVRECQKKHPDSPIPREPEPVSYTHLTLPTILLV